MLQSFGRHLVLLIHINEDRLLEVNGEKDHTLLLLLLPVETTTLASGLTKDLRHPPL